MATENHLVQPGLQAARNRAEAWVSHQARRLGVTSEAINATVARGRESIPAHPFPRPIPSARQPAWFQSSGVHSSIGNRTSIK